MDEKTKLTFESSVKYHFNEVDALIGPIIIDDELNFSNLDNIDFPGLMMYYMKSEEGQKILFSHSPFMGFLRDNPRRVQNLIVDKLALQKIKSLADNLQREMFLHNISCKVGYLLDDALTFEDMYSIVKVYALSYKEIKFIGDKP